MDLHHIWSTMSLAAKMVVFTLVGMGIWSLVAGVERLIAIRKSTRSSEQFAVQARDLIEEGDFEVHQVDVETDTLVWSWRLSDHPEIETNAYGDANWAGIMTNPDGSRTMVISLCADFEVIGVDMATGALAWSLGRDGTLELTGGDLPRCQHGLDIDGDRMLLYDNGARPTSRASSWSSRTSTCCRASTRSSSPARSIACIRASSAA